MFYSHVVLTKKGPLGKVWVAATLGESRISKSFAVNAQITIICKNIEQPPAPFALRLSSALLLGVVRVFNRKSSIILADANSVMQTLMRYKLGHNTTTTTTKRKSHGKSNATNANRISLNDADNIARFDRITIPVSKKRKTAIVANKKLIANAITIGQTTNNLGDQPSPATITIDSFSYGGSGEIDVLAAMETVFPTLLIPNDANPLPIALSTGSQQNRSSVTRRLSFMARDQDITLSNPSIHVGGAPIELSDQELQLSFHSNPASNHDLSQDAWMPGFTSDDQLALQANIHQSPDGNQMSPANPHDDVSLEPLQIAPLEIMPVDQPRAQFTGTAPQARNSIMNSSKRPSPARSVMMAPPSLSNEDLNRDGNSYQNTTPEQNIRRKRVSPVETSSTQKKKRRSPLLRIDTVVELSPSQVRDSLRDTTDIVLAEFDERSPKRRKRSQKNTRNKDDDVEDDLPMPGFVGGFAKDITDFWRDITTKKKTISKGNQSNETRARSKQGGKKAVVREDASSAQAMQRTEVAVPDNEEVSPPQVILGNEEVGVGSGRGDSSVDIDRGGEGSKSRSNDQFSLPSNSQGRDSSGRGNVNNAPSSNGSRNLADLIDTITNEDRRHYENAITSDKGQMGPGQTLSDRANSSSKSTPKPPSNVLVEQEHDEIEPLAQSSDIQLIEQTEGRVVEDERESPSSGGLSRINVRAFKLVEVIRRLARERAANGDGNEQGELPTFNELVVGCSRGTVARAFYSLLCLVNARFIDVEQEQAYGTIKMMASDYF